MFEDQHPKKITNQGTNNAPGVAPQGKPKVQFSDSSASQIDKPASPAGGPTSSTDRPVFTPVSQAKPVEDMFESTEETQQSTPEFKTQPSTPLVGSETKKSAVLPESQVLGSQAKPSAPPIPSIRRSGDSGINNPPGIDELEFVEDSKKLPKKWIFIFVSIMLLISFGAVAYWYFGYNKVETTSIYSDESASPDFQGFDDQFRREPSQGSDFFEVPDTTDPSDVMKERNNVDNLDNEILDLEDPIFEPELDFPVNSPVTSAIQDSDQDGLEDRDELILGTNPFEADSDQDGLDDKEELGVYQTDPLNSDTDGDGYMDGAEVKNGYDPNGPGKLFPDPRN